MTVNVAEVRLYRELFYAIPAELDEYYEAKTARFIDQTLIRARQEGDSSNTFAGLALEQAEIVGLHVGRGVARTLRRSARRGQVRSARAS